MGSACRRRRIACALVAAAQQCLERVLEHGDEFHEIGDVLQRHKTLKETEQVGLWHI